MVPALSPEPQTNQTVRCSPNVQIDRQAQTIAYTLLRIHMYIYLHVEQYNDMQRYIRYAIHVSLLDGNQFKMQRSIQIVLISM